MQRNKAFSNLPVAEFLKICVLDDLAPREQLYLSLFVLFALVPIVGCHDDALHGEDSAEQSEGDFHLRHLLVAENPLR